MKTKILQPSVRAKANPRGKFVISNWMSLSVTSKMLCNRLQRKVDPFMGNDNLLKRPSLSNARFVSVSVYVHFPNFSKAPV